MRKIPSAQITIWIPGQNYVAQGKVCEYNGKMAYMAAMSERKWFRNYNGYAISKRVIDSFAKVKFNPTIIYYRPDLNTTYTTTRSKFTSKGILVCYGGHSQYILPIHNWKATAGIPKTKTDYPTLPLPEWERRSLTPKTIPVEEKVDIDPHIMIRLKDDFFTKYPELRRTNG